MYFQFFFVTKDHVMTSWLVSHHWHGFGHLSKTTPIQSLLLRDARYAKRSIANVTLL